MHTPFGVRLTPRTQQPGPLNWLFLPGGPGIGSESLRELVDSAELPGTTWLVDLPGDGSNTDAPGAPGDPYTIWPQVLLEAVDEVPNPVYVGHSTGGMYLLSTPQLETRLTGLVLVSTAPDSSWLPEFVKMTEQNPLPEVITGTEAYEKNPTDSGLAAIAVASAAWNFGPDTVDTTLPTLIISGSDDRIVTQQLWDNDRYRGPNITHTTIDRGAHFAWIENPAAVKEALHAFARTLV